MNRLKWEIGKELKLKTKTIKKVYKTWKMSRDRCLRLMAYDGEVRHVGSNPAAGHSVLWASYFLLASLHPGVKMGTSINWRATCNGLASHPGGNRNILSRFIQRKLEINTSLMNQFGSHQTDPFINSEIC